MLADTRNTVGTGERLTSVSSVSRALCKGLRACSLYSPGADDLWGLCRVGDRICFLFAHHAGLDAL